MSHLLPGTQQHAGRGRSFASPTKCGLGGSLSLGDALGTARSEDRRAHTHAHPSLLSARCRAARASGRAVPAQQCVARHTPAQEQPLRYYACTNPPDAYARGRTAVVDTGACWVRSHEDPHMIPCARGRSLARETTYTSMHRLLATEQGQRWKRSPLPPPQPPPPGRVAGRSPAPKARGQGTGSVQGSPFPCAQILTTQNASLAAGRRSAKERCQRAGSGREEPDRKKREAGERRKGVTWSSALPLKFR